MLPEQARRLSHNASQPPVPACCYPLPQQLLPPNAAPACGTAAPALPCRLIPGATKSGIQKKPEWMTKMLDLEAEQ